MDVNLLISRLQTGEISVETTIEGQQFQTTRPPSSTALQAARALQQLVQINEGNMRVIQQLSEDNESLHEQIKLIQSSNSGS